MAILGPEREWQHLDELEQTPKAPPPERRPVPRRKAPARKRSYAEELLAQQEANRQAELDEIQRKMLYSQVLGRPDESMIPAAELASAGFDTNPTRAGLAYGIPADSLSPTQLALIEHLMTRGRR